MELVVKLPANKPPFIGIVFDNLYEASTINQDLLEGKNEPKFTISIEPYSNHLDLKLLCSSPIGIRFYKVKYNPEKLESWFNQTRHFGKFNFAHLMKEGEKEIVVRTRVG